MISNARVRSRIEPSLALVAVAFGAACAAPRQEPEPDPLLPLATLFAARAVDGPQLSPDGSRLAYLGPSAAAGGATNLFVGPAERPLEARAVTRLTGRGVPARDVSGNVLYRWTLDGTRLIFPLDRDGDERWNLHVVDVGTGEVRNLTPLPGVKVELLSLSGTDPDVALVAVEERAPGVPDLYRLDLETAQRSLVLANDGRFLAWSADHAPLPRLGYALNEEAGIDVYEVVWSGPAATTPPRFERLFEIGPDDFPALQANSAQQVARFDAANRRFFFYDSRGRDKIALVAYDLESRQVSVLAEDARVDLAGVLFHPLTHEPQAFATLWTRAEWHALDEALRGDLERLRQATAGEVSIESRSADDRRWVVRFTLADEPERFVLYERPSGELLELFIATPQLAGLPLAQMHALELESRDGLPLVSYLSLPPWTDRDGDGRPASPVPLVVLVHGGPSDERARYGFGAFVHWLANRGYGVLYANYRGSPGFGKAFVNAQRGEWGGKMHQDLVDQVEWAIGERITTRERVAILGGSYGGYAVLVGMTMTPDVFACGVDLVGPSSLEVFMPHWNVEIQSRILGGDPRTEEGRAFLRSRSPLHQAHRAKHPLLIGQGAHDSRVPQAQSDQMVKVLQEHGVPVTYVLYPDEGHGLVRRENVASFWAIAEAFLAGCLGGRHQPISEELVGSSAQVLAGAEHVPGLLEALSR